MNRAELYDVIIVGGGPCGATAATDLARKGLKVMLLDRAGRIKPCGGAVPPRLLEDFEIPDFLVVARVKGARIVSPSDRHVDMPIGDGFVGMVDREDFDEWLRERAQLAGAVRRTGTFKLYAREANGFATIHYREDESGAVQKAHARLVIGADGALSAVARQCVRGAERMPYVFAYHEIVRSPRLNSDRVDGERCDVYYRGTLSPDFYGWIFPHGDTISVGTGSANKGFSLRNAVGELRSITGLGSVETVRCEGAPIPLQPMKRWDNGRDVLLAGDAAGVVAPASGEGIYYAMLSGRIAAETAAKFCDTDNPGVLAEARSRFMRLHGGVFWILGMMQRFWYSNDNRRERFVAICKDRDVQELTWEAYMNKELVKAKPLAHVRIFAKNLAHLTGIARP